VFVYRLTEPVDEFDGLTPLPQYLHTDKTAGPAAATKWALQAVLALADAARDVGWRGDMRHLPSVGVLATPPGTTPYLLVKQDDNGATFIISDTPPSWLDEYIAIAAETVTRSISPWTHPTIDDLTAADHHATPPANDPDF
jgi:hypothetical protein